MSKKNQVKVYKKLKWKDKISALEELLDNQGWGVVLENIKFNLKMTEQCILTKQSIDGEALTDHEIDMLREKRNCLMGLINTPEVLIASINKEHTEPEQINYDPFKTVEDVQKEQDDPPE